MTAMGLRWGAGWCQLTGRHPYRGHIGASAAAAVGAMGPQHRGRSRASCRRRTPTRDGVSSRVLCPRSRGDTTRSIPDIERGSGSCQDARISSRAPARCSDSRTHSGLNAYGAMPSMSDEPLACFSRSAERGGVSSRRGARRDQIGTTVKWYRGPPGRDPYSTSAPDPFGGGDPHVTRGSGVDNAPGCRLAAPEGVTAWRGSIPHLIEEDLPHRRPRKSLAVLTAPRRPATVADSSPAQGSGGPAVLRDEGRARSGLSVDGVRQHRLAGPPPMSVR